MLDPAAAEAARATDGPVGLQRQQRRQRRRALAAFALLALAGHALLLDGLGPLAVGAGRSDAGAPLSVRTIDAGPAPAPDPAPRGDAAPTPVVADAAPAPRQAPARASREPAPPAEPALSRAAPPASDAASAPSPASGVAAPGTVAPAGPVVAGAEAPASAPVVVDPGPAAASAPAPPSTSAAAAAAPADAGEPPSGAAAALPAASAPPPLLSPGEQPPTVYRTQLPAPATLHYQVRSGFFRGTGEIRWRRTGAVYSVTLDARVAGLTLLRMASDGEVDAAGLAPRRFLDQRARRAAQAANFQRDAGRITFSGASAEWPLLAGSQDQLSWMIQLAGIASADPGLLVEGGRITMVVVGARGDARVWTLRYAGRENVETGAGTVAAVKLVRDGVAYDRGYEIWLDPAQSFLPAHVTRRDSAGNSEFDLLLDRVEPAP